MKADLGSKGRGKIHRREQTVYVHIGDVASRLSAMNRQIPDLHLQAQRNRMETTQFHSPPGCTLDGCDQAATDHLLERLGGRIPEQSRKKEQKEQARQ